METPNIITIGNLELGSIQLDLKTKLESMTSEVYKKPLKELTNDQVTDLINIHINIHEKTMNIYCQTTRQVEQYQPNAYSAAQTIDLENAVLYIKQRVNDQVTPSAKIEKYIEMRSLFYKLVHFKYHSTEDFLRNLIRESETKDEVRGLGRFAK